MRFTTPPATGQFSYSDRLPTLVSRSNVMATTAVSSNTGFQSAKVEGPSAGAKPASFSQRASPVSPPSSQSSWSRLSGVVLASNTITVKISGLQRKDENTKISEVLQVPADTPISDLASLLRKKNPGKTLESFCSYALYLVLTLI